MRCKTCITASQGHLLDSFLSKRKFSSCREMNRNGPMASHLNAHLTWNTISMCTFPSTTPNEMDKEHRDHSSWWWKFQLRLLSQSVSQKSLGFCKINGQNNTISGHLFINSCNAWLQYMFLYLSFHWQHSPLVVQKIENFLTKI